MSSEDEEELERAVLENNVDTVRALLAEGADVNMLVGNRGATLLHVSSSLEISKELLRHGAKVDARNWRQYTPLHFAVKKRRGVAMVRELLKQGACVNAINHKFNTPLTFALQNSPLDLEVIRELLEYGADINNSNCHGFYILHYPYGPSPYIVKGIASLNNAVNFPECGKLLIKFTLIKNCEMDCAKIIHLLKPFRRLPAHKELIQYLEKCGREIDRMKVDKISDNLTVYEFVRAKDPRVEPFHIYKKIDQAVAEYPIYKDIISRIVTPTLERGLLVNKFSEVAIYVQNQNGEYIILNSACAYHIAQYLSNHDIENFLIAFGIHDDQSDEDQKLDKPRKSTKWRKLSCSLL